MQKTVTIRTIVHCMAVGAIVGFIFDAAWWFWTGNLPELWMGIATTAIVTTAWSTIQSIRFQRAWRRVEASYQRPAFGEDR